MNENLQRFRSSNLTDLGTLDKPPQTLLQNLTLKLSTLEKAYLR